MQRLAIISLALTFLLGGAEDWSNGPLRSVSDVQVADLLIIEQDTFYISETPLESFFNPNRPKPKLFPIKTENNKRVGCAWSSACFRGYRATWEMRERKIYLREIRSCCKEGVKYPAPKLDSLLNGRYKNGKAFASWYSGNIFIPHEDSILYSNNKITLWSEEVHIDVSSGKVIELDTISNTPYSLPKFKDGTDDLNEYVKRKLKVGMVNTPDSILSVGVKIKIGKNGSVCVHNVGPWYLPGKTPDSTKNKIKDEISNKVGKIDVSSPGYIGGKKSVFILDVSLPLSKGLLGVFPISRLHPYEVHGKTYNKSL